MPQTALAARSLRKENVAFISRERECPGKNVISAPVASLSVVPGFLLQTSYPPRQLTSSQHWGGPLSTNPSGTLIWTRRYFDMELNAEYPRNPASFFSDGGSHGVRYGRPTHMHAAKKCSRNAQYDEHGLEAADYAAPTVNTSSTGPWWLEVREALLVAVGKVLHRGLS